MQHNDQLPVGLKAQLVERCTGIAEVMGSNPVQTWIFFRRFFNYQFICAMLILYLYLQPHCTYMIFIYLQPLLTLWGVSSQEKKINGFFRSHQIKESLCLRVVLWMIKICDFLSPFSIPIGWKVISNYFLWLFITTHPQSGPTWASVFSCAILPIYRWSGC